MNRLPWLWLAALALLGWAPALAIAYGLGFALTIAFGWHGPATLGLIYLVILGTGLFLLTQIRSHYGLATRFTTVGGAALTATWAAAYAALAVTAGWI